MSLLNNLIPSFARTACTSVDDTATAIRPLYEVNETPEAFRLTVQLPGVAKDGLELTAENGELHIVGRPAWQQPENWTAIYRETAGTPFELVLTHDNAIDIEKIAAELTDGVLRVSLPKSEALKPRKIAIG